MFSPVVIKTMLATAGITDPALCAFVADLVANSDDVKHEICDHVEVLAAIGHVSNVKCLKVSGTVKGKPMLAYLVLTKE